MHRRWETWSKRHRMPRALHCFAYQVTKVGLQVSRTSAISGMGRWMPRRSPRGAMRRQEAPHEGCPGRLRETRRVVGRRRGVPGKGQEDKDMTHEHRVHRTERATADVADARGPSCQVGLGHDFHRAACCWAASISMAGSTITSRRPWRASGLPGMAPSTPASWRRRV